MATTATTSGNPGNGSDAATLGEDPFAIKQELERAPRPVEGESSSIVEFYRNRNVLITGASGFIGKVLIEKLLRTCPKVGKIYVLVRPKRGKQPSERVRELLESPLFDGVRRESAENLEKRVIVVEGDVTQPNLGLSAYNMARVTKDVSVIYHSAATVKFDEPLKQSVAINIAGTKNMINLCRRIPHLAGLVHVSTAYANCDIDCVDEHIYPVDMDPEKLIQMADWLDQETLQQLKERLLGARPNTYTYTKALAEWLLVKSARDLPVVICRPSIVVASANEPFKGWIDNVNGPTGVILGAGKGLIRSMYAKSECVADLVPVDKVINLIITLGWFAHEFHAANRKHHMEESLADSLIGSSAASSSSVAGSSAASTSGDSLEDQQQAEEDISNEQEQNFTSGHLSLTNSENSTTSVSDELPTRATSTGVSSLMLHSHHHHHNNNNHHHSHHNQLDDGYGSRSPRYANSIASTDSASSSLSRRHRQVSEASSASAQKKQQDIAPGNTTTTMMMTAAPITCENNDLTTDPNLCDTNREQEPQLQSQRAQQMRRRRRRSQGSCQHTTLGMDSKQTTTLGNPATTTAATIISTTSSNNESFESKLKEFRQRTRARLVEKDMPDELADIPVFHCTSGSENPITWGEVSVFILAALSVFPSTSTYRYPCGSFTGNWHLDKFYSITLHYIPGYIVDFITRLVGGKPIIVKLFRKFDQAANVLQAFTTKTWHFQHTNRLFLINELMSKEDKRLFDCDIKSIAWREFCLDYVAGVRKFLLKEPMSTLEGARKNLRNVFYRNLSIQLVFFLTTAYYMASAIGVFS